MTVDSCSLCRVGHVKINKRQKKEVLGTSCILKNTMIHHFLLIWTLTFAMLAPQNWYALACKCIEPSTTDAFKMADTVVLGIVTKVKRGGRLTTISVKSVTCFKGDCHSHLKFRTPSQSASCGLGDFTEGSVKDAVGSMYLLYSIDDPEIKKKLVYSCSGTKRIHDIAVPGVLEIDMLYKMSWVDEGDDDKNSGD
jgi:hypothetical protein